MIAAVSFVLSLVLSYGWWTAKHNRHHAHPNTEDADPDIMKRAELMLASFEIK